jgi:hypothetical protein
MSPAYLISNKVRADYETGSEEVLVFQKTDGSGEFPNGTLGVPVGQGLHIEKDPDDRPICNFIIGEDAGFVHWMECGCVVLVWEVIIEPEAKIMSRISIRGLISD